MINSFLQKSILIVSPESWNHIFVSKHHYAIQLAKRGNVVFFLNPPSGYNTLTKTDFVNLYSVTYSGFPKGLRLYPEFLKRYFIKKIFDELQTLCSVKFDVVWSFDSSVFFDFSVLPLSVLKICHIVDHSQEFQLAIASRTADYCFCTSESIRMKLMTYNVKAIKIQHGTFMPEDVSPVKLKGSNSIKALYAGNLSIPYLDWNLLSEIIILNSHVDFILIGPFERTDEKLLNLQAVSNCFFYGAVQAVDLQSYYASSDVLFVTYKEEFQATQLTNPHKMMEYLGSGKMIVATHTTEFEQHSNDGLFLMSNRNSDYLALFKKAIAELEYWNNNEIAERRRKIALDNTYDKQIERIESIVFDKVSI